MISQRGTSGARGVIRRALLTGIILGGVGLLLPRTAGAQMIPSAVTPNPGAAPAPASPPAGMAPPGTPPATVQPKAPQPPAHRPARRPAATPRNSFHVQANLVNLNVSVETRHGRFVPGLTRNDFKVYENGRRQKIAFFSVSNATPLTLAILLDTSPSQKNLIAEEEAVAGNFLRSELRPKDLALAISFDENITLLSDFTASADDLARRLDRARIGGGSAQSMMNPGPFPSSGRPSGTRLWDAIVEVCRDKLSEQVGRKAIIVITDGQDEGSRHSWRAARRALLDSNTSLYALVASDPAIYREFGGYYGGAGQLKKIARASGGQSFNVTGNQHLERDFRLIGEELRDQYTLAYVPGHGMNGRYYRIKVRLAKGQRRHRKVRTRKGYFALARAAG